jgi:hypothetical protein
MAPILGIWASSKSTVAADTGAMFPLQVITVGSAGASSVTFTNIPNTYTHLQIRGIMRDSRATFGNSGGYLQFNGDTGSNYSAHQFFGDGSSLVTYGLVNQTNMGFGAGAGNGAPTNTFGAIIIDILDYANTNKNKTIRILDGVDINGTVAGYGGVMEFASGSWRNTSAVTSIKITPNDPNYRQYTSFALYGVKSA